LTPDFITEDHNEIQNELSRFTYLKFVQLPTTRSLAHLVLRFIMHRALLLPEIVAIILQSEATSRGFLHTALLINRLFSLEATRMLWKGCSTRLVSEALGNVTPDIRNLVHIIQMDLKRAQFYANFIHVLIFDEEGEDLNFSEEAAFHKELAVLEFPNLEQIGLYGFPAAMPMNSGDVALHYARPNVTEFVLDQGSLLSDSFLEGLSRRCPKLKIFGLGDISENTISEVGIFRFIERYPFLTSFKVRRALVENWTLKGFMALAAHLNLEALEIPDIPDDWLNSLCNERPTSPSFPKVKELVTGMSDRGLALLAPYMPDLDSLTLNLEQLPPSHHILESASNFARITTLFIEFGPGNFLDGHDLVHIAKGCPELKGLEFSEWVGCRPLGVNMRDSIIEEAAQHMRKMCVLVLAFDRAEMVTWKSVLSFARHAHSLVRLKLSCNFTWKEAMSNAPANTFPKIWSLYLVFDENNRGQILEVGEEEETLNSIAVQLAAFAPKLSDLRVDGNRADDAVEDAVTKICRPRYVPKPYYGFE
jgi:hypothetical protein